MANYNFFESYIEPPKRFSYERVIWITLAAIFVLSLTFVFVLQYYKINDLNNQLALVEEQLQSPQLQKTLIEVNQVEEEMKAVETSYNKLLILDLAAKKHLSFDYNIFKDFNSWVPENAFIKSLDYNGYVLSFDGHGDSIATIALFERQLANSEIFHAVRTSTLNKDSIEGYTFNMVAGISILSKLEDMIIGEKNEKESSTENDEKNNEDKQSGEVEVEAENAETQSQSE